MSGAVLDPTAADRLARLLGMLGSAHDGEIANAGRMADKMVRSLGLTWRDVIAPDAQPKQMQQHWHEPTTARQAMAIALRHIEILSDWERQFVRSLRNTEYPSPRQIGVLDRIIDKIRESVCEAA